ncbi:MAG TPA: sigma 54-interacting transcriptional regulator, partial [Planctomycetota bacterium]|nr:sigma 54-interacting transcriptional regulator [Planctomycetota bacterium]
VLLDVDNFNHANQTLGRRAADEILVRAADRIGRTLSADSGITAHRLDLWLESHIGRFGGDEFAFLLFDVTRDEARRLTDQILAAIREDEFDFEGRKIKYTATAGVAMYPSDAADLNKLFIKSYHALYTAKVNGKDRCGTLGPANDSIPPPIDSGELGRSSRGKALSAAIGNVASHAGSRIEALVHAILRDMLKAVPAQRARIVLFDDQDKPRYSAAEGAWGDGTISRTRLLSSAHIRALLENEGHSAGIVELERREGVFTPEDHALINAFAARLGPEIDRSRRLQEATSRLRELEEQVRHGLRELQHRYTFGKIIGRSKTMQDLFLLLEKVAAVDYPVIIEGETGVGKELVAKAIHFNSRRRDRPFIPVNCAAVSETLLESELFGHEKGAFTGADKYKPGLFELSAGGTLFIDEIEEMSEAMQKKLLRVLEEEQMRPVGGKQFVPVDVRVIASTNTDTEKLLNQEKLREDLYYRLSTFVLSVPALRDRAEDVPLIAEALIGEIAGELAGPSKKLTPSAMNVLMGYSWPGNVRELRNELRKAYVMCEGDDIEERNLSVHLRAGPSRRRASGSFERAMQDFERSMILDAMEMYDWNISRGAEALGMARNTLKAKLKAYNLRKP